MVRGVVPDPLTDDRWRARVLDRLSALEARPQVTPPSMLQAMPMGGGLVTDDWYRPMSDASFSPAWRLVVPHFTNMGLWVRVPWNTEAGTAGRLRIVVGDPVEHASDEVVLGTATSGVAEFRWLHQKAVWEDIDDEVYIQTYRTAGANYVNIGYPAAAQIDPGRCTTAGV